MRKEHNKSKLTVSEYLRGKGYQTCEYVQSSKGQYIDTEIIASHQTGIEIRYMYLDRHDTGDYTICGARYNHYQWQFQLSSYTGDGSIIRGYFASHKGKSYETSGNEWINTEANQTNTMYTLVYNSATKLVTCPETGISRYNNYGSTEYTTPVSLTLFALKIADGSPAESGRMRIYYCFIDTLGNYIRKYYPVYNISTGAIGLYDLVSDSFFGNNGSGSFTKGADVEIEELYNEL